MAATTTEGIILEALLAAVDDVTLTPAIAATNIQRPGVPFTAPTAAPWLRVTWLPASTRGPFLTGTGGEYRGLLQIDVFAPVTPGSPATYGATPATELAGQIAAAFYKDRVLTRSSLSVRILKPASVGRAMEEPGWIQVPVSIPYVAYA